MNKQNTPQGFVKITTSNQYALSIHTDDAAHQQYAASQKHTKKTRALTKKARKHEQEQDVYLPLHDMSFLQHAGSAYDDLRQLPSPDVGALLYVLYLRYTEDKIYTALGNSVLISINPYKEIEELYGDDLHEETRRGRTESVGASGGTSLAARPHIFSIAERAYSDLLSTQTNQAILISGESGSGKTEATKRCLRYLVAESGSNSNIERRLLSANPVLEAFGNALTTRNHNSSRFGKWVEISFGTNNLISGCMTTPYLLEKSRVVQFDKGESNYHVLHILAQECYSDVRARHGVAKHHQCRILHSNLDKVTHGYDDDENGANGGESKVDSSYVPPVLHEVDDGKVDDVMKNSVDRHKNFRRICQSMDMLDFSDVEIDMLWRVLSIVLHLGNLVCVESKEERDEATTVRRHSLRPLLASPLEHF